jgi:hypothetical protein
VRSEAVIVVAYLHGARDFATWRQEQGSAKRDESF